MGATDQTPTLKIFDNDTGRAMHILKLAEEEGIRGVPFILIHEGFRETSFGKVTCTGLQKAFEIRHVVHGHLSIVLYRFEGEPDLTGRTAIREALERDGTAIFLQVQNSSELVQWIVHTVVQRLGPPKKAH